MSAIKRIMMIGAASVLLSGCAMYRLEELRHTDPHGTAFQNALAKYYMDFATTQEKGYDWLNSWHFAEKGLLSAYGKDVGPEALGAWNISADKLPEMQRAREQLVAVLTPEFIQAQPEVAAKAQYSFDCWVKYQDAGWNEEEIGICRDNLNQALASLHGAASLAVSQAAAAPGEDEAQPLAQASETAPPAATAAPAPMEIPAMSASAAELEDAPPAAPAAKPAEAAKPAAPAETATPAPAKEEKAAKAPETASYIVFFEADKAAMSVPGARVIDEVIKSLQGQADYEVVINGHADDAGDDKHNMQLSEERVKTVRDRLVAGGVHEDAIQSFSYGKSDPKFPTSAKGGEAANRRVEIFLND